MRAVLLAFLLLATGIGHAKETDLSTGQTLYLPIYSHLLHGNVSAGRKPVIYPLSALISLRNTDPRLPIRILSANYYDSRGKLVRSYFSLPQTLPPLGSLELFVERNDLMGGSGANFLITWQAEKPVNPVIAEALHADITGNRTLSFLTTARPIK